MSEDIAERPTAESALALIRSGEVEAGLALYEQCLHGDRLPNVPVGLHIGMLEQDGLADAAARLRRIGLRNGADLAVRAGSFLGADHAAAVREYDELFAAGVVNSRMIYEYAKALAGLGRMEEHARILAPDKLFRTQVIDSSAPGEVDVSLADAVDSLLLELEGEAEQQDSAQSVRNMRMYHSLHALDHPVVSALMGELARRVEAYLAAWRESDHPFAAFVPKRFKLEAWGLINRGTGFNIPHIHGYGWGSGVFYPRSVDAGGGDFVIGKPVRAAGTDEDWGTRSVTPTAGLLILMPSFFTHWTAPLGRPGLRTSVAFDVAPAEPA